MSRFIIPYEENKGLGFPQIMNFLVSFKIMPLVDAIQIQKRFRSQEDVVIEIPDQLVSAFKNDLEITNWKYKEE